MAWLRNSLGKSSVVGVNENKCYRGYNTKYFRFIEQDSQVPTFTNWTGKSGVGVVDLREPGQRNSGLDPSRINQQYINLTETVFYTGVGRGCRFTI